MGEAGCLKDGVFKNLQVNGNIDLENAISKSMPLRKTVVYDYAGFEAGKTVDDATGHTYTQTVNLPANAFLYKAYAVVKQVNTFSDTGNTPTGGNITITGNNGVDFSLTTTLTLTQNNVHYNELSPGEVGLTGNITIDITPITAAPANPNDIWEQVGKFVIVLDYCLL